MARKLDRHNGSNDKGLAFQALWQRNCEAVEANVDDLQSQITAIAAAQAAAAAAQTTANTAVTNAATAQTTANTGVTNAASAQTTANTVKRDDSITSSYTAPGTVLSATDAGANATITIAAHTRVYGDISNVAVNSGSITSLPYSTLHYVYYDDATRVGGAVTYHADTNSNHALPNKAAGRHFVGSVTTPAALGAPTSGGTAPPSGGGGVREADVGSTL